MTESEPLVKPLDSLIKGLFLGKLCLGLAQVPPNSKAVDHPAEKVNLIRIPTLLLQDFLGLVPLFFGEDLVGFCTRITSVPADEG